ncbi:MAG: PKD domain-containing protein, partial [Candidatus Thermoplasmatota archaeon]|nr:PKD domain-containing protein [Candidatus Thermoplasmatota archaeon]
EIIFANFPPENLRVTPGTTWTHKNTDVTFTMSATDPDINDTIRFSIDWGDGTNLVSDHLFESGSDFETSHQWETFGLYPVEVTAFDEANASSETVTTTMYVDVLVIDDVITGWLIDLNSNETFDVFRDTVTKEETNLSKYNESTYLIDADGDGEWDYLYNIDTETLTVYTTETPDDDDLSYVAILILVGLILLLFIIFAYIAYKNKKERKRREQQKKQEKEQKKKKPEEKKTSSSSKGKKRSSKKKNK